MLLYCSLTRKRDHNWHMNCCTINTTHTTFVKFKLIHIFFCDLFNSMRFRLDAYLFREKTINFHFSVFLKPRSMCRLRHIIGQADSAKKNCRWRRCWIRIIPMASLHPYWIIQVNYLVTKFEKLHAFGYRSIHTPLTPTSTSTHTSYITRHSDILS